MINITPYFQKIRMGLKIIIFDVIENVAGALLATFMLLFVNSHIKAQESYTITGSVKDSVSKQPLAYSTIAIKINATAHYIKADSLGNFAVNVTAHIQTIVISHTGYNAKELPVGIAQQHLGNIFLTASGSLETIVVQGKSPPVSFKIDRQVYKASEFASGVGGTSVDIIKNLPSIVVDAQGNVNFRGSQSFLLLVNGKPVQADAAIVLSQISAGSIENIELITSPSAAYDADGKSGAINIITKTGIEDGLLLQTSVMAGAPPVIDYNNIRQPQRYGLDIALGYKKNKWDINGGINYLRNDITGYREGDVFTLNGNIKTSYPSMGERSFKRYNYAGRIALGYTITPQKKLSAGFYIGKKYQSRDALLYYDVYSINTSSNDTLRHFSFYNPNVQEKQGIFTLVNLGYEHIFRDQSKLNFNALYEGANLSGNTYNPNLAGSGFRDTLQYTFNPNINPLYAYRFKTDYERQFKTLLFQAGYQYRYDTQNGNFLYYKKDPHDNELLLDAEFTSRVLVKNYIHAAYLQANGNAGGMYYGLGSRIETTQRFVTFSRNNQVDNISLVHFFPSAQLRYKPASVTYKAAYNRRIRRTNNFELNPLPEREHSETLEQGDPYLLPELISNFETGIEKNIPKGSLFATLYHQRVKNPIQRVNKIYNDTILNRAFTNAGRMLQTGLEASINKAMTTWWQIILGGNIYYYDIAGKIFDGTIPIRNFAWVYSINTTQTFNLPRKWSTQLSVNYLSERVTAQGKDGRFLTPNLAIKKTSKDNRWNFQLLWMNMDAGMKQSNRQRITTWGDNFYTTTNYIYEPDQFQLSIGYNLSKRNRKIALPQSEIGEKEF